MARFRDVSVKNMYLVRFTVAFLLLACTYPVCATPGKSLVVVQRPAPARANETAVVVLSWTELTKHNSALGATDFTVTETNFGRNIAKQVVDTNNDGIADEVIVRIVFSSDERIYGLAIQATQGNINIVQDKPQPVDSGLKLTYLYNRNDWEKLPGKKMESWPDAIIASTMSIFPEPAMAPPYAAGEYSYEFAFFLNAMFDRWKQTQNPAYLRYIRKWADRFIDSHGTIDGRYYKVADYKLDDILPGRVFLSLYEVTKDRKYKNAADQLKSQLQYQPRTAEGGYWHKKIYPYQMWLEGAYMAGIFCMQYGTLFNETRFYSEVYRQLKMLSGYTLDDESGLMYHGWDESLNASWANPDTGTSPEFWSRGMAWYLMALVECLDYFPNTMIERKEVGRMSQDLAKSILKYQDKNTSLWLQVMNKSHEPSNWIETSASAMFAYAIAKQFHMGVLRDKSYLASAQNAFNAITSDYIYLDDEDRIYLDQTVKVGTLNPAVSKADFEYYAGSERRLNDYKGLGALLYLAMELEGPPVKKESE